jgi:putative heme-binding domain-containing protein
MEESMVKQIRFRVFATMGLAGLTWVALTLPTAATQVEGLATTRNPLTSPADVAAGAKTFRSHCASCHGVNGEGGRGPNLASGVFFHGSSDLDLLNNISDGIQGTEMPGLFYSPDRVWQVVAFLRSLNAGKAAKPTAEVDRGTGLFKSKGCHQCHRVNGEGGRLGPDLSDIGRTRSVEHLRAALLDPQADVRQRYWVVSFKDSGGKSHEGFLMNEDTYTVQFIDMNERLHSVSKSGLKDYKVEKISRMPSFKDSLSSSELEQLVAYLSSLRPKGGAQ